MVPGLTWNRKLIRRSYVMVTEVQEHWSAAELGLVWPCAFCMVNSALEVAHRLSDTQLRVKSNWTKGGIVIDR